MPEAAASRRVCFVTLGCAKNEADSERMRRLVEEAGFSVVNDPERADITVVNTCAFIEEATEESIEAILDVAATDRMESGQSRLVVSGCMPSRYGDELERELPEAAAFIACKEEAAIVAVIEELAADLPEPECAADDCEAVPLDGSAETEHPPKPMAYVKISEGCDRFCSYCTIPFIRGRYASKTYGEIEGEVGAHVAEGVREIVLIAQDTGRWGDDLDEPTTLARLIADLAERFPETWFRVMYIQPEGITDDLLKAISAHDNACSYLDIPVQHVEARILESMNRTGSYDEFIELVESVRQALPDVALRTTVIVGYPGETEEDFELLCEFLSEAEFDYVGAFAYSPEEGTKAASLPDQVSDETKLERLQRVRDLADAIGSHKASQRIGRILDVLVTGEEEDGQLFGRAQCQAPDVDGVTYVDRGCIGEVIRVRIDDALLYDMEGECV